MSKKSEEATAETVACQHVFCYGSLRPDDDSAQPWTQDAVSGMRAQPAKVTGAKLYEDVYAAVVLDDDASPPSPSATATTVTGWVLTADAPLFSEKLEYFDMIEGYKSDGSGLYQRSVVNVSLGDPSKAVGGEPVGIMGATVKAFIYHRPDCNKDNWIPSGDWLLRGQPKTT